MGFMASPKVVKSGVRDLIRQQVRFFQALALQFCRQTQAGGGGGGDGGKNTYRNRKGTTSNAFR
ncbi:hypothetical protein Ct61P_06399 [Colletotrichum tofieldiae]|nr:hypothetical protein Ct61P_06399 [Colletotrichum tofieldiae]